MPNDMHAKERQARLERELKCKSVESDKAHCSVPTSCLDPHELRTSDFCGNLAFLTCLFLDSPLSGPHERRRMAARKEQLSSLFFVA